MDSSGGVEAGLAGRAALLTGGTGFLGAVILERLLRVHPSLSTVYLLVRPKSGLSPGRRAAALLETPLFSRLDEGAKGKVVVVEGDVREPGLGLSAEAAAELASNAHFLFHVAANINFKAPLDVALRANVGGTRAALQLAKRMPNIKAFVYVSTAFCNCTQRDVVAEAVYPAQWDPDELLRLLDQAGPEEMRRRTSEIIGGHPNTYSFSKLMAENLIDKERGDVPIVIIRPSIVLGTLSSPVAGWIENVNSGAFAFIAGAGRGVFRSIPADGKRVADLVPADLLASLALAAASAAAPGPYLRVYHFTSGQLNPIRWSEYLGLAVASLRAHPCLGLVLYPRAKCRPERLRNRAFTLLHHYLPALTLDAFARLRGERPIVMDIQWKYTKGMGATEYFTTKEWQFSTKNTVGLLDSLGPEDRIKFDFDVRRIDWPKYLESCVLGIRKYYHGYKPESLPRARAILKVWWTIDKLFWIFILFASWFLISKFGVNDFLSFFLSLLFTLFYMWL